MAVIFSGDNDHSRFRYPASLAINEVLSGGVMHFQSVVGRKLAGLGYKVPNCIAFVNPKWNTSAKYYIGDYAFSSSPWDESSL